MKGTMTSLRGLDEGGCGDADDVVAAVDEGDRRSSGWLIARR